MAPTPTVTPAALGPKAALSPLRRAVAVGLFAALVVAIVVLERRSGQTSVALDTELGFRLEEVAQQRGLVFQHRVGEVDPRIEHMRDHVMAVGAAVSAADVDNDGHVDLYATNSAFGAPNALFHNRGDGSFRERAAEWGLADLNQRGRGVSMGSVFGDLDNDGDEDLLVYRFGYLALLRNDGPAGFVEITREAGLERWVNSNGAIWFDYDRDGWLDLFVEGYYRPEHDLWNLATTKIMHNSGEFATNGAPNLLFRNRGDGTFEERAQELGLVSEQWTYAAVAADFDRDGWPDLYVANDYGAEELWRNVEGQRFELVNADLGHDSKSGMSVSIGNVRNDGVWSVFVTNISERGYIFHGNNLRTNRLPETGKMEQVAKGALVDCGWAWCGQFGDLDNDGFQDLVVANGFISGDRQRSYWYDASKLSSGSGGLLEDAAYWPPIDGRSQSGYQRTAVLWNNGRGAFVNVSERVGVTDELDGRAVVMADLENDGSLDVIVANQKGPLLLYSSQPDPQHGWIGFQLLATRSNRSAIGAEVELEFGRWRQLQVVSGGSGFSSQNDRRLHFGLGRETESLRATVRWPSGEQQVLEDLTPGRYHRVVEPSAQDRSHP
jgi:hypothetical protein